MRQTIQLFVVGEPDAQLHELKKMLAGQPDIVVSGEVTDPSQVSNALKGTQTEVVLVSLNDAKSGIRDLSQVYVQNPQLPILALSDAESAETIAQFLQAGARGHLHRSEMLTQGLRAMRQVKMGEVWAPRRVLELFAHKVLEANGHAHGESAQRNLTDREAEVFHLVSSGISNKEIARTLNISDKTVKTHLQNIFRKLSVHRRQQVGVH